MISAPGSPTGSVHTPCFLNGVEPRLPAGGVLRPLFDTQLPRFHEPIVDGRDLQGNPCVVLVGDELALGTGPEAALNMNKISKSRSIR